MAALALQPQSLAEADQPQRILPAAAQQKIEIEQIVLHRIGFRLAPSSSLSDQLLQLLQRAAGPSFKQIDLYEHEVGLPLTAIPGRGLPVDHGEKPLRGAHISRRDGTLGPLLQGEEAIGDRQMRALQKTLVYRISGRRIEKAVKMERPHPQIEVRGFRPVGIAPDEGLVSGQGLGIGRLPFQKLGERKGGVNPVRTLWPRLFDQGLQRRSRFRQRAVAHGGDGKGVVELPDLRRVSAPRRLLELFIAAQGFIIIAGLRKERTEQLAAQGTQICRRFHGAFDAPGDQADRFGLIPGGKQLRLHVAELTVVFLEIDQVLVRHAGEIALLLIEMYQLEEKVLRILESLAPAQIDILGLIIQVVLLQRRTGQLVGLLLLGIVIDDFFPLPESPLPVAAQVGDLGEIGLKGQGALSGLEVVDQRLPAVQILAALIAAPRTGIGVEILRRRQHSRHPAVKFARLIVTARDLHLLRPLLEDAKFLISRPLLLRRCI